MVAAEGALERGGGGEGGKGEGGERGQSGQVTAAVYLNRLSDFLFVAARYRYVYGCVHMFVFVYMYTCMFV